MFTNIGPRPIKVNAFGRRNRVLDLPVPHKGLSPRQSSALEISPSLPDYHEIERVLREAGVTTSAAEAHGIITGVLCAPNGQAVSWQNLILGRQEQPVAVLSAELVQILTVLYQQTHARLYSVDYEFEPLLPGDDHSFQQQIDGLADWCRGYLFGLLSGGVKDVSELSGDASEIVADIFRISEAEAEEAGVDEADARAFAELVEYIRVGVQLVFEELQPPVSKH